MAIGNYLTWFTVFAVIGISTTSKNIPVFLKADYRDGKLTLICSVTSLVFKTDIYDPRGKIVGSCSAPIHQLDVRTCSTPETLLDLDLNRTILTINNPENKSIEGVWKCSHGTNRGSDDVYVQPYFKPYNFSQSEQYADVGTCSEFVFIAISVTCVITVGILHINTKYSVQKRICRTIFQSRVFNTLKGKFTRSRTRTTSRDSEMEGLIEGDTKKRAAEHNRCHNCGKETSFSLCLECKKFYCETCANTHSSKLRFRNHTIRQTNLFPYKKQHEMKCKSCPENHPEMVCKKCENVLCITCSCPHSNDKDVFHPLIPPSNPIVPTTRSKNQDDSEVLRKKYTVSVSDKKFVTRIRGIAYLKSGGLFALADYKNKKLKVFSKYKLVFEKYLNMEPRGMTGISGNKIAVTFAYEKKIIFYEVAKLDASKCDEFNLKQIGKPFEIAYHKDHFIVELNEGIDGCIVILDDYCNKIYEIQNEDSQFGYFTGNTIRLQLDMDREEFYVAAIGRKAVYCLDFYGAVKWLVKVPSPRSIAIVPNTKDTTLLFASHKSSAIYKLICKEQNGSERYKPELIEMEAEDETTLEEDKIKLPEYISYDHDNCLLYTEVANGHVSVYHLEKQKRN
ncbi:Hypothetical predicted protein [Mytilus galloprovincialis]|uniref:B box-type domain-containing protein n=1 Tax=Mytilus galloprovincialis TaxID=29158 RepID=A0A8B6FM56_MYTGA|nr:Hypothetical predicted protein [Mytilus galloprovincialis]